jgi:8-oxo-dGTP diphosphatase
MHRGPAVKVGTGVIVIKGGKVLTGIRKGSHGAGHHAFPGGHIDPEDESLEQAAEREVAEETGIVCKVRNLPHGGVDLVTTFDILSEDKLKRYVTVYVVADYISGGIERADGSLEPMEPHKCEQWHWDTLDELKTLATGQQVWIPIDRILYHRKVIGL